VIGLSRKRSSVAVSALLIGALLNGGSAGAIASEAADVSRFVLKGASATWWSLGDPEGTSVEISIQEERDHDIPGRPVTDELMFVVVQQSFCDQATDEVVFRQFSAFEQADVNIRPSLQSASVDESITLDGFEARAPGCKDSGLFEFTNLGDFVVRVSAQWSGVGPLQRSRDDVKALPTCKAWSADSFRDATAMGSITGDLDIGGLGTTESPDANLISFTRKTLTKDGEDCLLGSGAATRRTVVAGR
jgi:hypothetical protein